MNRRIFFEGANLSYRGQLSIFGPEKRRFLAFVFVKTTFSVVLESGPSIFDLSKLYVFSCRQAITELTNNSAVWARRVTCVCTLFLNFKLLGWDKQKEEYTWPLPLISAIRYYHTIVNYPKNHKFFKISFLELHQNSDFYKNADVRPPFTYASLIRQVRILKFSIKNQILY